MGKIKNKTSKTQRSSYEMGVKTTPNETDLIFIVVTYRQPDGSFGYLNLRMSYSSFRQAVNDATTDNPTSPEELQELFDLHAPYWKKEINKERALNYVFKFLIANPLVRKSTLETYSNAQTFGILLAIGTDCTAYELETMPTEFWNQYVEAVEILNYGVEYKSKMLREIIKTLLELNYELHHARILDHDENAARQAETAIKNSIEKLALNFSNIPRETELTYKNSLDYIKSINEDVFKRTEDIVIRNGRDH